MRYEEYEMRDGNVIRIPRPTNYKDCIRLIQSDNYRVCGKVESIWKIYCKTLFNNRAMKVHFWFRLASYKGVLYPLCIVKHMRNQRKFDLVLSAKTRIGWGFYSTQTTTMFIQPPAIIGNNVNLTQMLSIGSNNSKGAMIGDNVYIGPMTCLVEDVQIGRNTSIGAGSVVCRDIPAFSTAVGTPAKVIGENKHPGFIRYPWKDMLSEND